MSISESVDISSTTCCALASRDSWYAWYPAGSWVCSGVEAHDSAGVLGAAGSGAGSGTTGTVWNFLCLYLAWRTRFRNRLCSSFSRSFVGLISMGFPDFWGFLGAGSLGSCEREGTSGIVGTVFWPTGFMRQIQVEDSEQNPAA